MVKTRKWKPNKVLKKLVVTAQPTDGGKIARIKRSCPSEILSRAVVDVVDAFNSNWQKFKKRKKKRLSRKKRRRVRRGKTPFNVGYKSKRASSDSMGFEGKSAKIWTDADGKHWLRLFHARLAYRMDVRIAELPRAKIQQCCRIVRHCGRWYFVNPRKEQSVERRPPTGKTLSLDPGARSMFTYFCPQNQEWGDVAAERDYFKVMRKVNDKRDRLRAAMREKPKLKRAWYRQLARASNLVKDFHYKTIAWMLGEFDTVICPTFKTSDMQCRDTTALAAHTREELRFLCHYKFRQRLLDKAKQTRRVVLDVNEAQTTMGCSACGYCKRDVGQSKVYRCDRCGVVRPRDMNSAVDIWLKRFFGAR